MTGSGGSAETPSFAAGAPVGVDADGGACPCHHHSAAPAAASSRIPASRIHGQRRRASTVLVPGAFAGATADTRVPARASSRRRASLASRSGGSPRKLRLDRPATARHAAASGWPNASRGRHHASIAVSRAMESQGVGGVGFLQATGQPQQQGRAIERRGRGQGGQRARPSSVRGSRPQRRGGGQQRPEAHRPVRHRQRRRIATERSQGGGRGDVVASDRRTGVRRTRRHDARSHAGRRPGRLRGEPTVSWGAIMEPVADGR